MEGIFIVDIVIALILLINVILGFKRGFIKTIFSCFSVVVALFIASAFGEQAGIFIMKTDAYDNLTKNVRQEIHEFLDKSLEDGVSNAEKYRQALEENDVISMLSRFGVETDTFFKLYETAMQDGTGNVKNLAVATVTQTAMATLAKAVGTLAVFILSLIALKLLSMLLGIATKLPVIKSINKFAGVVAGLAGGVLTVCVLCMAVEILLPYIPENPVVYMGMAKDTVLYKLFLDLNPVILILFA